MNIALWVLQVLLAVHTLLGAVWKVLNPPAAVSGLTAIPRPLWLGISVIELFLALGLVLPAFHRPAAILAPLSAAGVAAIMLAYSAIFLYSRDPNYGQLIYWLVVAALCAVIVLGRLVLSPLQP